MQSEISLFSFIRLVMQSEISLFSFIRLGMQSEISLFSLIRLGMQMKSVYADEVCLKSHYFILLAWGCR